MIGLVASRSPEPNLQPEVNDSRTMKKRKFFTRLKVTGVLLLAQIILFFAINAAIVIWFPFVAYFLMGLTILALAFIIKKEEAPAYKITWITIILLLPLLFYPVVFLPIGGAIYLMIGNRRPLRKITAHVNEHALIARLLDSDELPNINNLANKRAKSLFDYVRRVSSYHAYENTNSKYYNMGEDMFKDMLIELEKAEKFIFIEFFIVADGFMWGQVLDILSSKASEGLEVRVIIDDLGSEKLFSKRYIKSLKERNIHVLRFNPMVPLLLFFMNNRDHRKIMVVDGKVAFTGGMNIADEYINIKKRFGIWKDTGVRLEGDAVWSFTLMFIEMWDTFSKGSERINNYEAYKVHNDISADSTEGFVLPFGDTPLDKERLSENIFVDILYQARDYVYFFTPYLIISEKLTFAMQHAAKRGVDVRIVMPGIPDKKAIFRLSRSYYGPLLNQGVRIFEYSPGFLHAKSMVSDDRFAVVGTVNLDYRSLYLHFECGVVFYKSKIIDEIKHDMQSVMCVSKEVLPADKRDRVRRVWDELIDALLHLFAPLL